MSFLLFLYDMSEDKKIIAIDAMSGDKGPNAVLGGMNQFLYQNGEDSVHFRLFGDEKKLRRLLAKYPRVARNVEVIHAPNVIKMTFIAYLPAPNFHSATADAFASFSNFASNPKRDLMYETTSKPCQPFPKFGVEMITPSFESNGPPQLIPAL